MEKKIFDKVISYFDEIESFIISTNKKYKVYDNTTLYYYITKETKTIHKQHQFCRYFDNINPRYVLNIYITKIVKDKEVKSKIQYSGKTPEELWKNIEEGITDGKRI